MMGQSYMACKDTCSCQVMTSPIDTRNITGTYGPGYGLHTISVMCRSQAQGMTIPHNPSYTAQRERKLNWLCNGRKKCVTEKGGEI